MESVLCEWIKDLKDENIVSPHLLVHPPGALLAVGPRLTYPASNPLVDFTAVQNCGFDH